MSSFSCNLHNVLWRKVALPLSQAIFFDKSNPQLTINDKRDSILSFNIRMCEYSLQVHFIIYKTLN